MNKFFKKLVTITAIVGGLFAQQASAVEAYTNELTGSETLPAGTYGAIDIQDTTAQALAANFVVPSTEILNAGVDNLIASNHMQSHTVQFWFKTAALSNSNIYYFRSTTTDRSNGYDLQLTDTGKLRFYVYNGLGGAGTSHFTTVTSPIVSNTWTHIAAVITKHATATQLAVEIFINGVSYASGTNSATKTNMDFANAHASFCPSNLHPGVFKEITFESGHTLAGIYIDDEVIDETKIIEKAISSLDQPPIFFKNLSFELMNGTQITTLPANQISSGFDTTNYDSDFWTNAGGPNVETGITINATDEPDGIASAFTKDAVGNTGGLQISTRPLSASTRITLKWWAKAQWSGKSRVQLMIADQP
ncbi:MAG: LamG domain-containing protein, partial [Lentisphaeria bacterium]|nr:LamG domain-containing protein [Lentisphaeria bacterium]